MTGDRLPIYLLPGMEPQYPVYSRLLPLLPNAHVVPFINPGLGESLTSYARRMAHHFSEPCLIGGVSFGGILAQEISRVVRPAGCIVIASIQRPSQLPPWLRFCRLLGGRRVSWILNTFGSSAKHVPRRYQTQATARLTRLSGTSGRWHRWASSAVLDWKPVTPVPTPLIHIHGDADTTFPIRYTNPDTVVQQGRHALPMSHPAETASAITDFLKCISAS